MRKPKTVEIVVHVRVPKHWSAAHTRKEIAASWYGEVYANDPPTWRNGGLGDDVSLFPRWGKARVVKSPPDA